MKQLFKCNDTMITENRIHLNLKILYLAFLTKFGRICHVETMSVCDLV